MNIEDRIKEIRETKSKLENIIHQKRDAYDFSTGGYDGFERVAEAELKELSRLDCTERMIMEPEFDDMRPGSGNVMSLKEFIEHCKDGNFIDYDGSGNYVRGGKVSNIAIYPSDVKNKFIRTDFDTVIWYNR